MIDVRKCFNEVAAIGAGLFVGKVLGVSACGAATKMLTAAGYVAATASPLGAAVAMGFAVTAGIAGLYLGCRIGYNGVKAVLGAESPITDVGPRRVTPAPQR